MGKSQTTLPFDALSQFEQKLLGVLYDSEWALSAWNIYFAILKIRGEQILNQLDYENEDSANKTLRHYENAIQNRDEMEAREILKAALKTHYGMNPGMPKNIPMPGAYTTIQKIMENLKELRFVLSREKLGTKTARVYYLPDKVREKIKEKRERIKEKIEKKK